MKMTRRERALKALDDYFTEHEWTTDDIITLMMGEIPVRKLKALLTHLKKEADDA